jgi:hypothetical protein
LSARRDDGNVVGTLEKIVDGLQKLPADVAALGERVGSVETRILRLRTGMRSDFSELRSEIRTEFAAVRSEMREGFASARNDMLVGLANVTSELGKQIRETAEEGKRHSQMLFEEVLGRIATLREHRDASPGRKAPAPRRKR